MKRNSDNIKLYRKLIYLVSVLVPLLVTLLFTVRLPGVEPLTFLPPIYSGINGIVAILIPLSIFFVRRGSIKVHSFLMKSAIVLSSLFLVMYMAYHMTSDPTPFGGEGLIKYVYFFILITHIVLSIVIIPLVLITFIRGEEGLIFKHKKIARIATPLWMYVAVTGVVIYLMISPYY